MGGLFDSGTKQVQQQATTSALPQSEVTRLAGITGQQQKASLARRKPPQTILGVPVQPVGNTSPYAYGVNKATNG